MADVFLDVVDEEDKVIGKALRSEIHTIGLIHREVHVWYVTLSGGIVFQRRAPNKETFPNLLDATVGGHVELGMSYEAAALMEMQEETGIIATVDDLYFIDKSKSKSFDDVTKKINHCFRSTYGYIFNQPLSSLCIEVGQGEGFVEVPIEQIMNPPQELSSIIVPALIKPERKSIYTKLQNIIC